MMHFFTFTIITTISIFITIPVSVALPHSSNGLTRSTMKISARSSILESTDAANSLMDAVLESRATLFPDLSPGSLDILGGNSLLGVTNLDTSDGSLIEAFSHKAGDAGYAGSGDATGGRGGNGPAKVRRVCTPAAGAKGGDANSGAGGNSDGGSVIHNGRPGITLISLFSDNAGNGGIAPSGAALGGDGGDILCA